MSRGVMAEVRKTRDLKIDAKLVKETDPVGI